MELDSMSDLEDDEETGLTHTEREQRTKRKTRNTQLDERIAGSGIRTDARQTKTEKEVERAALIRRVVINGVLIGLWYTFSISISVYNKWMFSKENLDFHFPLFTTSLHMLVQFALSSLVLCVLPRFRPGRDGSPKDAHGNYSRVGTNEGDPSTTIDDSKPKQPLMTKSFYLTRISPCGTATALDIGLGNFSLRFISLTFFTMCKSSVLAFVLLFAFLFRLESPTWRLCLVILAMTAGVIMMVAGEAAFNTLGFILVMTASFCSGFRWSLTQILLLRNPATSNPFSSIFFLTPVMFAALFILAIPIEGFPALSEGFHILTEEKGLFLGLMILLFPGFLAFMMVAAEFALLKRSSVVTLSVCGIFKEVLTISAASFTFGDPLSPINVSGLVVTIVSIAGYNWLKYSKMRSDARKEAHAILEGDGTAAGKRHDLEEPDEFDIGRDSTSTVGLMRDSLALATDLRHEPGGTGHGSDVMKDGQSPIKRPEDPE